MRAVYDVTVPTGKASVRFKLPRGAVFLNMTQTPEAIVLFYEVDTACIPEEHELFFVPHKAEFPAGRPFLVYRGTITFNIGNLVFHLFEDIGKIKLGNGKKNSAEGEGKT